MKWACVRTAADVSKTSCIDANPNTVHRNYSSCGLFLPSPPLRGRVAPATGGGANITPIAWLVYPPHRPPTARGREQKRLARLSFAGYCSASLLSSHPADREMHPDVDPPQCGILGHKADGAFF